MQLSMESSSQPQPGRAPPTDGKSCATSVPESLSARDNVIQMIKIETSTGSADVTKQSASSEIAPRRLQTVPLQRCKSTRMNKKRS